MAKEVRVNVTDCYDVLKKLHRYARAVAGVRAGPDVMSVKIVDDLKKLLSIDDAEEAIRFLQMKTCDEFRKQIGFAQGYNSSFSVDKLNALVHQVVDAKKAQDKMNVDQAMAWADEYEDVIRSQNNEIAQLERKVKDLLRFQEALLTEAKDKARFTAGKSKRKYDELRDATIALISKRETARNIDVDSLTQKLRS